MARYSYPRVYKFQEKHGDWYYLVQNEDQLIKMFRQIFEMRKSQGWYDFELPKPLEELSVIPEGLPPVAQEAMEKENERIEKFNRNQKSKAIALAKFEKAAIDDHALLNFMDARSDYQYEEWELLDLQTIE